MFGFSVSEWPKVLVQLSVAGISPQEWDEMQIAATERWRTVLAALGSAPFGSFAIPLPKTDVQADIVGHVGGERVEQEGLEPMERRIEACDDQRRKRRAQFGYRSCHAGNDFM